VACDKIAQFSRDRSPWPLSIATVGNGPPYLDPAVAYPELGRLRLAVLAGDWPAVVEFFAAAPPDDHTVAARLVGETPGAEGFLGTVVAEQPDPLAHTLLAARLIDLAFAAGGDVQLLHRAEPLLLDVTAREPANVTAWTLRLASGRGLRLGVPEAWRRYGHAACHEPQHFGAQFQLLQQLSPRWGGTAEQLHQFALDRMLAAPKGSLAALLVVEGHLEGWLVAGGAQAGIGYLRRPTVRDQIMQARTMSVQHPAFRGGYRRLAAHSTFAMVLSLLGDARAAATHFLALGDFATWHPWAYLGDPVRAFLQYRAVALASGPPV
jgi:hypothetical protein